MDERGHEPPADAQIPPPPVRPSRRSAWLAMGAVALALGLLWTGSELSDPHVGEQPGDAEAEGRSAPLDFTLKDMHGVDVKLASFKGKPIIINFWATWCGPCLAEIPALVELQTQYPDLVILGVSVDDPVEKLKPYAEKMKMNYPVLVGDQREDFQDAYGPLWGIPVTVFIDRDGKIAKKHSGIASKEQFEREIKALL
jgi:cytochrome c biogenesis protein CcmG, thiol:disulfide interchange protein DsbE